MEEGEHQKRLPPFCHPINIFLDPPVRVTDEWRHVRAISYGNFLLRDYNDAVSPPDPHRRQSALRDGFKGIFCKKEEEKSRLRFKKIRTLSHAYL